MQDKSVFQSTEVFYDVTYTCAIVLHYVKNNQCLERRIAAKYNTKSFYSLSFLFCFDFFFGGVGLTFHIPFSFNIQILMEVYEEQQSQGCVHHPFRKILVCQM